MSSPGKELDSYLWEVYLLDCKASGTKPSLSDFDIFVQEADYDRKENYERSENDDPSD